MNVHSPSSMCSFRSTMRALRTTLDPMSTSAVEPAPLPAADEATVRQHGTDLRSLAAEYGIDHLRFASSGRLVGHVDDDRDGFDTADFEIAARALLGAEVGLFPDRVLNNPHVSPDLVDARPV